MSSLQGSLRAHEAASLGIPASGLVSSYSSVIFDVGILAFYCSTCVLAEPHLRYACRASSVSILSRLIIYQTLSYEHRIGKKITQPVCSKEGGVITPGLKCCFLHVCLELCAKAQNIRYGRKMLIAFHCFLLFVAPSSGI